MIQCTITLEKVKPLQFWGRDEFTNWLHPSHGPLPHYLCTAHTKTDHYLVAVWLHEGYCITALECPEKPTGRGSIFWTARWPRGDSGEIFDHAGEHALTEGPGAYETDIEFLRDFIPAVVEDAETAPLGSVGPVRAIKFRPRKS